MKALPAVRLLARARARRLPCRLVTNWFPGVGGDFGLYFGADTFAVYDRYAARERLAAHLSGAAERSPTHSVTTLYGAR